MSERARLISPRFGDEWLEVDGDEGKRLVIRLSEVRGVFLGTDCIIILTPQDSDSIFVPVPCQEDREQTYADVLRAMRVRG